MTCVCVVMGYLLVFCGQMASCRLATITRFPVLLFFRLGVSIETITCVSVFVVLGKACRLTTITCVSMFAFLGKGAPSIDNHHVCPCACCCILGEGCRLTVLEAIVLDSLKDTGSWQDICHHVPFDKAVS